MAVVIPRASCNQNQVRDCFHRTLRLNGSRHRTTKSLKHGLIVSQGTRNLREGMEVFRRSRHIEKRHTIVISGALLRFRRVISMKQLPLPRKGICGFRGAEWAVLVGGRNCLKVIYYAAFQSTIHVEWCGTVDTAMNCKSINLVHISLAGLLLSTVGLHPPFSSRLNPRLHRQPRNLHSE